MLTFNHGHKFYNGDKNGNNPGLEGKTGVVTSIPEYVIEGIFRVDLNTLQDYYRKQAESIDTVHIIKSYELTLARINNCFDVIVKNDYDDNIKQRRFPVGGVMVIN